MGKQPQIYNSLDMPMSVFMNAYCDKDLSNVENFEELRIEYSIAIGGKDLALKVEDSFSYQKLKLKVMTAKALIASYDLRKYVRSLANDNIATKESVDQLLKSFESKSDEQIFEELKSLRYHTMLPNPDFENLDNYCKQINGWIMNDVVTLKELENELPKQEGETIIQDRNYFTDIFIAINSALHLNINETSSVRMFCRAAVQYINYRERQEALNQKAA